MDPRFITPVLIGALVIWGLYRRARRFIGRQPLEPRRLWTRVLTSKTVTALLAGASCGAALGWLGLKYTRFETTSEGRFYTPHAYIGLIVTALLVGRLLYRFVILYSGTNAFAGGDPGAYADHNPYASLRTPLTFAMVGALVGYYASYYLGVLSKSRQPAIAQQASGAE